MDDIKIDLNLEYPVSIEAILNLSFNLDSFKLVFQFILEALRRHESNFHLLQYFLYRNIPNKDDYENLKKSIIGIKSDINDLQSSSKSHDEFLSRHSSDIDKIFSELSKTDSKFENYEKWLEKHEKLLENEEVIA